MAKSFVTEAPDNDDFIIWLWIETGLVDDFPKEDTDDALYPVEQ